MRLTNNPMLFPRIAHIITDLNGFGGTEATLFRYITESSIPLACHLVIVLKSIGGGNAIGARMVAAGVLVVELGEERSSISLGGLLRLYRELKKFDPDVISGWLYHPSLLATLLSCFLKRPPAVVWHIRCSTFASIFKTPSRFVVQRMLAFMSRVTNPTMVSNSSVAVSEHATLGFDARPQRWTIIHNGIDVAHYLPSKTDRVAVRRELGIPENALLIGCVGRFVPEKGYDVMFDTLEYVLRHLHPELSERVHFLAIGEGVTVRNNAFASLSIGKIPCHRLHLLGKRADVPRMLRAMDLYVLPSVSEAFPNALVEAMATGLPCIATNVGECSVVLPTPTLLAPPHNAPQLAVRMVNVIQMTDEERAALGDENRRSVAARFGLRRMVSDFDTLFRHVAKARHDNASKRIA